MTSSSTSSGVSQITVTFELSRNQDLAAVDVQNRVSTALGRLPNEVKNIGVTVTKGNTGFVMAAGVYAENGQYDPLFLSNYLDVFVRDALKRIPGVADVLIFGERKYAMRLWLDPTRLAARGITASDVTAALREQNVQVAAGAVGQPPVASGQLYQISVRAAGRLTEPVQFENIIVKVGSDGTLIRLGEVGRAEIGAEAYSSELRFNGVEAVGFAVTQLPTANALDVYEQVLAELTRLEKNFPPGMKYQVSFDTATVVQDSIREVVITLLEAIGLVVLVMFLFLQDWRSTIIPTITIPVSLVGTFAFIKLLGFSINTLTLFGIVLATGIVVDDAIVVIENIQRHIQEYGRTARQAASEAMREVLGAVIATGLVLDRRVRAGGVFPRHDGPPLPAVLADHRLCRGAVGVQRRDAHAGAVGAVAAQGNREGTLLSFLRTDHRGGHVLLHAPARSRDPHPVGDGRALRGRACRHCTGCTTVCRRRFCPTRTRAISSRRFRPPRAPRSNTPATWHARSRSCWPRRRTSPAPSRSWASASAAPRRIAGCCSSASSRSRSVGTTRSPPRPWSGVYAVRSAVISGAIVVPFLPPPIRGLGAFGGFQFELLDQTGGPIENLAVATGNLVRTGNQQPQLRGLFSAFTAGDPQLSIEIDRDRVKSLNMPLSEVTDALQVYLGLAVRERLRLQQPRLSRLRAGRSAVPERPQGARAVLRTRARGHRWCRCPTWCACRRRRRRRSSLTSTCFDRPRSTARPRPASARVRRCWRCRTLQSARCRPACRTPGPDSRSKR